MTDSTYTYPILGFLEEINETTVLPSTVNLICYNVTTQGKYPFLQFMLYNSIEFPLLQSITQNLTFPKLHIWDKNSFHIQIQQYIKDELASIQCIVENINDIKIKGIFARDESYVVVDVSSIDITSLFLSKQSSVLFALSSEICNLKHVCNITVHEDVSSFFVENKTFLNLEYDNRLYPSPEVVYELSKFKQTQFQNMFGVSKKDTPYGNVYIFSLHSGKLGKTEKTEYSEKLEMEGMNRIALLVDQPVFLKEKDFINTNTNPQSRVQMELLHSDTIYILENDNSLKIIVKDYEQQIPLSFHFFDKKIFDISVNNPGMNHIIM